MAGNLSVPALGHLVQPVHPGRGLLGDTLDLGGGSGPFARARRQRRAQRGQDDQPLLGVVVGRLRHRPSGLELGALVHQQRGVPAVVKQHVRSRLPRPGERLLGAPPVLLQGLPLPGEHRDALRVLRRAVRAHGDRGRRVILGREDVAARPPHLGTERHQRLDQHRCLDGHVQRPGDPGAAQRLGARKLLTHRHQPRHLVLGEPDLLAAELGQRQVFDLERDGFSGHRKLLQARVPPRATPRRYGTGVLDRTSERPFLTELC